jgi:uncharacterized protein (UPF0333 family)
MDVRGQISIEFLLILGFIMVIVLMVASLAGPQIEENSITSAAREGASNALYELSSTNANMTPNRITKLIVAGNDNKTIQIQFSNDLPDDFKPIVLNETIESILNQTGFSFVNNSTVKGSSKYYTVVIS